jgi:hypothetical protein
MAETPPLPNDPAARTATGVILDPSLTTPETPPTTTETKTPPSTTAEPPKPPSDKALLNEDQKAAGAPEKYTDWKLPEGFQMEQKDSAQAGDLFRSLNLSQDQGQKLVDFYAQHVKQEVDKPQQVYQDMRKTWRDQTLADPDVGGNQLDATKSRISKVLDVFPDQAVVRDFKEKMDLTGAGDILSFVKIFNWMASRLGEGGFIRGNNPVVGRRDGQAGRPSLAAAMFPNLPTSSSG